MRSSCATNKQARVGSSIAIDDDDDDDGDDDKSKPFVGAASWLPPGAQYRAQAGAGQTNEYFKFISKPPAGAAGSDERVRLAAGDKMAKRTRQQCDDDATLDGSRLCLFNKRK